MGRGKAIAIALGVVLFSGSGNANASTNLPPPPDPDPDPDPNNPDPNPDPIINPVVGPITFPKPKLAGNLTTTVAKHVALLPTPGMGYRVKKGDVLFGKHGLVGKALESANQPNTAAMRELYYQALTRVRSNWREYGTVASSFQNASEKVQITDTSGNSIMGTIKAALDPVNDSWTAANAQGVLPSRLVQWNRNKNNGHAVPVGDWKNRLHGSSRTYGVLFFPPLASLALGANVSTSEASDWPKDVYAAAGTTWGAWIP